MVDWVVGLGLSLVGLLGGLGGSACVVDGGSMGLFFFDKLCWGFGSSLW